MSVLTNAPSTTRYVPHSEETRYHYEKLLADVRRCAPSSAEYEEIEELAEEVLRIVCGAPSPTTKEGMAAVKQQLDQLFGASLSEENRNRFWSYKTLLTDYVVVSAGSGGVGERAAAADGGKTPSGLEFAVAGGGSEGPSEEDDEEDEDEDDAVAELAGHPPRKKDTKTKKKKKNKNKKDELMQFAFDGSTVNDNSEELLLQQRLGLGPSPPEVASHLVGGEGGEENNFLFFDDDDGEGGVDGKPFPISFDEVACNLSYLEDSLRRLFPSQDADKCLTQAAKVLEFLSDRQTDNYTVETQLTAYLSGYESEEIMNWISEVTQSRWCVVFGLQYGRATTQKEKAAVMDALQKEAEQNPSMERLYQLLTGKEATILKVRGSAVEEGGEGTGEGEPSFHRLYQLDLSSYYFKDERHPHLHIRATVPPGTQRVSYETHDEIVLPPTDKLDRQDALKPLEEFPRWCQTAFPNVDRLNPMQTKVYPCAFESDENMLVSAPTGAGKTNVATMAMLRAAYNCITAPGGHHSNTADAKSVSIDRRALKMVYVAPMKALVQEVVRTFTERFAELEFRVVELSGDSAITQQQLLEAQLIVTTPEKWDIVTRKSVELGVVSMIKLIIIDEVHLLHNERGPVLEAIVARTLLQQQLRGEAGVRLVGLSATLPNVNDVASFLHVDRQRGLFVFDSSYRPIPLQQSYCAIKKVKGMSKAAAMNLVVYDKVLSAAREREQTMVFVHSRKATESTAVYLRQRALQEQRAEHFVLPSSASERALRECLADPSLSLRQSLRQLLLYGFAIHHAGLSREERETVETLFAAGHIRVLVCTSTLAWGVNLPANQVIINGTRVFSGSKSESELLSALDVLQMFGRAGRVGFGQVVGHAVIITTVEDLNYYLCVLNQQLPIESQMLRRVVDMLNAEVVLGHVENTKEGVQWLQKSYLYVRMRAAPEKYGIRPSPNDPLLLHYLENVIHTALLALQKSKMVEYDPQSRRCGPTAYGRVASFCYVTCASMLVYLSHLTPAMQDVHLFRLFSLSSEFEYITVRGDEQDQLRGLLETAPIVVPDQRYTALAKINILLQCYISRKDLVGLPLMSELVYIKDSAQRILRALYEISLIKEFGRTARQFLQLYLMVLHRQWSVQSPVRQVQGVISEKGFKAVIAVLEGTRLTWNDIRQWSREGLREKFGDERRGDMAYDLIRRVPHFQVSASVRPLTRGLLYVDVDVLPDFDYLETLHGWGGRELQLLIELPSGRLIHQESVLLPVEYLEARESFSVAPLVVPMVDPKPTHLFVRLCSAHWLAAEASTAVSLLNTYLPPVAPPLREVHHRPSREEEAFCVVGEALAPYGLSEVGEKLFPFESFYLSQRDLVEPVLGGSSQNLLVGLPPGGGKTAVAELFVLSFLLEESLAAEERHHNNNKKDTVEEGNESVPRKLVYVTSNEEVAERRGMEWSLKFKEGLEQNVVYLTRAASASSSETQRLLQEAVIVVVSAASLVNLTRREEPLLRSVTHLVLDHLHLLRAPEGRFLEECVATLNSEPFLVNGGQKRARLLALTYPLISTAEVGSWLRVPSSCQFNYGDSYRALQVRIHTLDLPGARARAETAALATLKLLQRPPYAAVSAVCFVPTATQAQQFARRVLLRCRNFIPESPLSEEVEDAQLGVFLAAGVGYLHRGTSLYDSMFLLEQLDRPAVHPETQEFLPLILVCTFDMAGRLPAASFTHALVCPERPSSAVAAMAEEGDVVPSYDCSVSELLWMSSRAMQECVVHSRPARRFALSSLLNEPLPLESYLRFPIDFRETVNAAVARGMAMTRLDVLRVLKTHYFLYHLQSNPSFYGIDSLTTGAVGQFASEFSDNIIAYLESDACIEVHGDTEDPMAALTSTQRGSAVAHHCLAIDSVVQLTSALHQRTEQKSLDLTSVLETLLESSEELSSARVGEAAIVADRTELAALHTLARALATLPSVDRRYVQFNSQSPSFKLLVLLLAYCTRLLPSWETYEARCELQEQQQQRQSSGEDISLPHPFELAEGISEAERRLLLHIPLQTALQLVREASEVLPTVIAMASAGVEVVDGVTDAAAVRQLMHLTQSLSQQRWAHGGEDGSLAQVQLTALTAKAVVDKMQSQEVLRLSVEATAKGTALPLTEDRRSYLWWCGAWASPGEGSAPVLMALRVVEMTTKDVPSSSSSSSSWKLEGDLFFTIASLTKATGVRDLDRLNITVEVTHMTSPATRSHKVF